MVSGFYDFPDITILILGKAQALVQHGQWGFCFCNDDRSNLNSTECHELFVMQVSLTAYQRGGGLRSRVNRSPSVSRIHILEVFLTITLARPIIIHEDWVSLVLKEFKIELIQKSRWPSFDDRLLIYHFESIFLRYQTGENKSISSLVDFTNRAQQWDQHLIRCLVDLAGDDLELLRVRIP